MHFPLFLKKAFACIICLFSNENNFNCRKALQAAAASGKGAKHSRTPLHRHFCRCERCPKINTEKKCRQYLTIGNDLIDKGTLKSRSTALKNVHCVWTKESQLLFSVALLRVSASTTFGVGRHLSN